VAPLLLHTYHFEQRLVVRNDFGDARCRFESAEARSVEFSLRKGQRYRKNFGVPTMGYAYVLCVAEGRTLQTPAHFHLIDKGLVEVILKPDGSVDVTYVRSPEKLR